MRCKDIHFPLYLDSKKIEDQISTIGIAFNRYNTEFMNKSKSHKCFCIALNKTKILSIGINRSKTNTNFKLYPDNKKYSTHAEIDMIINLRKIKDYKKVTDIWTVRGHINLLPSFPCHICLEYLTREFNNAVVLHYFSDTNSWQDIRLKDL